MILLQFIFLFCKYLFLGSVLLSIYCSNQRFRLVIHDAPVATKEQQFILLVSDARTSVSYTHLDVYKRQILCLP